MARPLPAVAAAMGRAAIGGNSTAGCDDWRGMRCEDWRVVLSATIDGEADDDERSAARSHAAVCRGCAAWAAAAEAATKRVRVAPAVAVPDRTAEVLARARARARHDVAAGLRVALVGVAVAQLALAGPDLVGTGHTGRHLGSWGVALGVGFLVAAVRPSRAAGLLPFVAALVASVGVTMIVDPGSGAREAQHLVEVVGLVLLWALSGGRLSVRAGARS